MLEHLQNHEAYAVLGIAPDISDGDLAKAYKVGRSCLLSLPVARE